MAGLPERKGDEGMKKINLFIGFLAAVLLSLGLGATAQAFHDGGVAHCDGCHTMHNSKDGQSIIEGGIVGTAGEHLTIGADPGSTCLNCHEGSGSYHIYSSDGTNLTPGGDFYWLDKIFTYHTHRDVTRNGHSFGHNVIAADYGLVQDPVLNKAPGGTFQSAWLSCSSCHDPHGKKVTNYTGPPEVSGSYGADPAVEHTGNYRLLADVGYEPGPGHTFTNAPPIATTSSFFGPGRNETDSSHTDYGQGMSEWCANCHSGFLSASVGEHRHPASNTSTLGGTISTNYNAYVATGDTGGSPATAYLALVPFERGVADPAVLDPSTPKGPDGSSNVMCLTCHRAHVSAFPNAGRWDFETEFLADSHPQTGDGGASGTDQLNSYYGRDVETVFGLGQRSLCNKCHIKD
jgi:hypothetical protein